MAESMIRASESGPCPCWTRKPALPHSGHCCFGYKDDDAYQYGQPPPCQHWHPDVPQPPKLGEAQAWAWIRRRCINCLTAPARAGGNVCDGCHRERMEASA